jgi:hypothetical protein
VVFILNQILKNCIERDPEKNILIEIDPYTGKKLRELPLE